ncbi:MAG: hypothetical protein IT300_06225 [Dehalococcoidia bacterium]|nr:hypothetical protein [Dehalococcoidia bacterium]
MSQAPGWSFAQIQRDWFGDAPVEIPWNPEEVERAFALAERVRGREWVLGQEFDPTQIPFPGIGIRGGWGEFVRVYWLGERLTALAGAIGAEMLLRRIAEGDDPATDSELTAIYLLRGDLTYLDLEIEPTVSVGRRTRRPDFRIRRPREPWTFVEVRQLRASAASERVLALLQRVVSKVGAISRPFLLEIVFWREPTENEENEVIDQVDTACQAQSGERIDLGDCASIFVKAGDPSIAVPSPLPDDGRARLAMAVTIGGSGEPPRQVIARVPFADERAEDVLAEKAKQLPPLGGGLIMVDAARQASAFGSWPELLMHRFKPTVHTRVSGVMLFHTFWVPELATNVKLVENPHAKRTLPEWIPRQAAAVGAEARRALGGSW